MKRYFVLLAALSSVHGSHASSPALEEVLVESDFRPRSTLQSAASVSVFSPEQLERFKATHLDELFNIAPNLNFATGASRGRFLQIRGVGERSQFVDPVNPSVGILVDGMDLTGLGAAATTLDLERIEILRGPQGTLAGANALAGLVVMESKAPDTTSEVRLNIGNYRSYELQQAFGGKVTETLGARVAIGRNKSDGFIDNAFLDRSDTQNIDELTLRNQWMWTPNDVNTLKLSLLYVDTDNGYDAFSLDNNRVTLSDQPGQDAITLRGLSLSHALNFSNGASWQNLISAVDSDGLYSYDEDWTFREVCAIDSPCAFFQYSTFDSYAREHDNVVVDSRFVSAEDASLRFVTGLYLRQQREDLARRYLDNDPNFDSFYGPITNAVTTPFDSHFDTDTVALYGQLDIDLADGLTLVAGARAENRQAEYQDSDGNRIDNDENLWGGKLALEWTLDSQFFYALVSRGYKAGGNNVPGPEGAEGTQNIPLVFETETMLNGEVGYKARWWDSRVETELTLFYQDRDDIQVKQSLVTSRADGSLNGDCPCDFTDFIGNAASGVNYGVEFMLRASLSSQWSAWLNLGGLQAEYRDFVSFSHVDADNETGTGVNLDGRNQAHAPEYQGALGFDWQISDRVLWQFDTRFKDAFFLSTRHEVKTKSVELINSRLSYSEGSWSFALWGKNLSDEMPIERGFGSFGNDPRQCGLEDSNLCYPTEPFYQFGAPRTFGVSAALSFD